MVPGHCWCRGWVCVELVMYPGYIGDGLGWLDEEWDEELNLTYREVAMMGRWMDINDVVFFLA